MPQRWHDRENLWANGELEGFRLIQDADEGEIAIPLIEVQTITDDELVRDVEAQIVDGYFHFTSGWF